MGFFGEIVETAQSGWEATKDYVGGAASWAQEKMAISDERDQPTRYKAENAEPRMGQPVGGAGVANAQVRGQTGNPQTTEASQTLGGGGVGGLSLTSPIVLGGGALALVALVYFVAKK